MSAVSSRRTGAFLLATSALLLFSAAHAADKTAPATEVRAVEDTFHGTTVSDPYRWLETASDPAVKTWTKAQSDRTRGYLDALPYRATIRERVMEMIAATSSRYSSLHAAGGSMFAMYYEPPKQQTMLVVLDAAGDPASKRIVVDPNTLDTTGATAIDWYVPSHDGKSVAVSLSLNGSEDGSVHVFDVASGKQVGEVIPRVQYPTAGGSLAWKADNSGFWYTRFPGEDMPEVDRHFYQQVYYHKLGDEPAKDSYVLGKDLPKIAEIEIDNADHPGTVLVSVQNGDGGEYAHYVNTGDDQWHQVTRFEDGVVEAKMDGGGALYLVSHKDAPRGKIVKLASGVYDLAQAKEIVPQSEAVIFDIGIAGNSTLFTQDLIGGPMEMRLFDLEGKAKGKAPLPDVASIDEAEPVGDVIFYEVATYLRPPYFLSYNVTTGAGSETKLLQTSPINFDDTEVVRVTTPSKDGTQIPINIIRRKGIKLDGSNPVLLYGYGGYGVNETPFFVGGTRRIWLDAGGVYAVANIRGGGEFGEEWHRQGNLTKKQNVFDDFDAAIRYFSDAKYTTSEKMAIIGGSNGGLLMGAQIVQHPESVRAVVSQVGIYDMLRVELDPNGEFNTTEFGTVKNEDQFRALLAYSPYHNVKDGTSYPAVYLATGENDGRVNPMQSRKMTARLQAATSSDKPIYLLTRSDAGHGQGSSLNVRVDQSADYLTFLFDQLGMTPPTPVH